MANHPGSTYEDLKSDIDTVARVVAKDYPDIDWEDLRQHLCLYILENGKSIKLKEHGGNPKRLLFLIAKTYAKKLRVQHMTLSPQYSYRPSDVSLILENAWQGVSAASYVPDDARDKLSRTFTQYDPDGSFKTKDVDPYHFPDAMEVASDVRKAFAGLKPIHQEAIFRRFALNEKPSNETWDRKRLNQAVNELTYRLNTYKGDVFEPQIRKSVSAAGARVRNAENYGD